MDSFFAQCETSKDAAEWLRRVFSGWFPDGLTPICCALCATHLTSDTEAREQVLAHLSAGRPLAEDQQFRGAWTRYETCWYLVVCTPERFFLIEEECDPTPLGPDMVVFRREIDRAAAERLFPTTASRMRLQKPTHAFLP